MPTLNFKGKSFVQNHHLAVNYHQLVPQKDKSLTDKISLHDNLIIQGDNLKALKALLPTYAGKIKCIYIDPPYNTGKEHWKYNDKVNSPMIREWLGKEVDKEDLTRHDKWLCMMMPRLKLLKELLSEDGIILVHIDDFEIHRLRSLMDEIFNEENLIANFVWRTDGNIDNQAKIKVCHEYILGYAKDVDMFPAPAIIDPNITDESKLYKTEIRNTIVKNGQKNPVSDIVLPIGFPANFKEGIIKARTDSWPHYKNDAIIKDFKLTNETIVSSGWSSKNLIEQYISSELKEIKDSKEQETSFEIISTGAIEVVKKRTEEQSHVLSVLMKMGNTQSMSSSLEEINIDFDYPKPVSLSKYLLRFINSKDFIVLDSFAGSGTTAHAVLDLNKEDGGNRKFILVEMEDYANNITAERVRRVINGVPASKNFQEGTGGTFSYFELGPPIEMESILRGENLPSYEEFAKYLFYTATGEEFDPSKINEETNYIGTSKDYEIYLFYKPDLDYLKSTALTLDRAKALGRQNGKPAGQSLSGGRKRLVFAPAKFVDSHTLTDLRIEFCQLPFEIYKLKQ